MKIIIEVSPSSSCFLRSWTKSRWQKVMPFSFFFNKRNITMTSLTFKTIFRNLPGFSRDENVENNSVKVQNILNFHHLHTFAIPRRFFMKSKIKLFNTMFLFKIFGLTKLTKLVGRTLRNLH